MLKLGFVVLSCVLIATPAAADPYAEARTELIAAYQAGDFGAMRAAAAAAIDARPGYPGALFNRAFAEVLDGDPQASLDTLLLLLGKGIDFDVADVAEFEPLKSLPGWGEFAAAVERLSMPYGKASVAYTHDVADFVPEGIAIGENGELYLGSIRHGTIVRIGDAAEILSAADGHWSVFGMRLDGRGNLWFTSASVPEYAGTNPEPGRTGLFRLNLSTRAIEVRALLPQTDVPMVLGDLVLADQNTIYATESLTGVLYRYSIEDDEFTEVVGPGVMRSMQGLVRDASGEYLYVADYVGGLGRVTLAGGSVTAVGKGDPRLYGIDGLYRSGNSLIAVQNGIRPHRVVRIRLADDGLGVEGIDVLARNLPEFDEPTLGTVVGEVFYFVANSHWNRFGPGPQLPDGLTGPVILELQLDDER